MLICVNYFRTAYFCIYIRLDGNWSVVIAATRRHLHIEINGILINYVTSTTLKDQTTLHFPWQPAVRC